MTIYEEMWYGVMTVSLMSLVALPYILTVLYDIVSSRSKKDSGGVIVWNEDGSVRINDSR